MLAIGQEYKTDVATVAYGVFTSVHDFLWNASDCSDDFCEACEQAGILEISLGILKKEEIKPEVSIVQVRLSSRHTRGSCDISKKISPIFFI